MPSTGTQMADEDIDVK